MKKSMLLTSILVLSANAFGASDCGKCHPSTDAMAQYEIQDNPTLFNQRYAAALNEIASDVQKLTLVPLTSVCEPAGAISDAIYDLDVLTRAAKPGRFTPDQSATAKKLLEFAGVFESACAKGQPTVLQTQMVIDAAKDIQSTVKTAIANGIEVSGRYGTPVALDAQVFSPDLNRYREHINAIFTKTLAGPFGIDDLIAKYHENACYWAGVLDHDVSNAKAFVDADRSAPTAAQLQATDRMDLDMKVIRNLCPSPGGFSDATILSLIRDINSATLTVIH